jgi:hypothetical protein
MTSAIIEEELKKLMDKEWEEDEKQVLQKLVDGFLYYKKLIPKSFKMEVIAALQICNKLKDKLDILTGLYEKESKEEEKQE